MHSIFTLQQCCQRGLLELILHLEKMNKLRHSSTLNDNLIEIFVWVTDELVNGLLICKHTILLVVLEYTKVRLSWHQKSLLNDIDKAEA